ncbi:hypothetical protein [Acutalibacter caecimuris]|nr:hypothetical protein [Acutalibacter sp. M00118]
MTIQMPEETYQRLKVYLQRHGMKQKEFIATLLEKALDSEHTEKVSG